MKFHKTIHGILFFSILFGSIISLIILHHGYIHNGMYFQYDDLEDAVNNNIKSHEAIILIVMISSTSFILGHYLWKSGKIKI